MIIASGQENRLLDERMHEGPTREHLLSVIGERMRAERKRQQMTLRQVADRTHLSVSLLSQIERAESAASVTSLLKIADALRKPLQAFFEGF